MIDKITIYEDDETKIQVDKFFNDYFASQAPQEFKLSENEIGFLLKISLELLKIGSINTENLKLIGNIPIIKSGLALALKEPYTEFNEPLCYLAMYPSLDQIESEVANEFNDTFEDFCCVIFPRRIFDVKGFILFCKDDDPILMFFGFKDSPQMFDFLDFS